MRLITIFFILTLLTACGASSPIKYTTVSVFKDKGGVFLGSNKEGQTVIGMSPYVAEVVASSNSKRDPVQFSKQWPELFKSGWVLS